MIYIINLKNLTEPNKSQRLKFHLISFFKHTNPWMRILELTFSKGELRIIYSFEQIMWKDRPRFHVYFFNFRNTNVQSVPYRNLMYYMLKISIFKYFWQFIMEWSGFFLLMMKRLLFFLRMLTILYSKHHYIDPVSLWGLYAIMFFCASIQFNKYRWYKGLYTDFHSQQRTSFY